MDWTNTAAFILFVFVFLFLFSVKLLKDNATLRDKSQVLCAIEIIQSTIAHVMVILLKLFSHHSSSIIDGLYVVFCVNHAYFSVRRELDEFLDLIFFYTYPLLILQ